jgi:hypothetical protein
MNDLERSLASMLHDKSDDMPRSVDSDPAVLRTARTRRRTKLAALGGSSLAAAVAVVAVGALVARDADDADIELRPAESTVVPSTAVPSTAVPSSSVAPSSTVTTLPSALAIEPGTLVAATGGRIVTLQPDGTVDRTIVEVDGRVDELAVRGNTLWYLTFDGEDAACGTLHHASAVTGADRETFGNVVGFGVSGDGNVVAMSKLDWAQPDTCSPDGGTGRIVVRDLSSGSEAAFPHDGTSSTGDPLAWHAERVALNHDGSILAAELCWEGCNVALFDVPRECIDGSANCEMVHWDQATFVDDGDNGPTTAPVFQGEAVTAIVCDCPLEGEPRNSLATFDPRTGDALGSTEGLPAGSLDLAIGGATIATVDEADGTLTIWSGGTLADPVTAAGTFTTVTVAYEPAD